MNAVLNDKLKSSEIRKSSNQNQACRAEWVDCAKAIGIVLVVYGHVARGVHNAGIPMDETIYGILDSVIYSFHMPLFFFLAGIFLFKSMQRSGRVIFVAGKVDTIIYPYIVWSLLQGGIEIILSSHTNNRVTLAEVLEFAWHPRAHFWFLYSLFQIMLLAAVLYFTDKLQLKIAVMLSAIALVIFGNREYLGSINSIALNFSYFSAGVLLSNAQSFAYRHRFLLAMTMTCAFCVSQWWLNPIFNHQVVIEPISSFGLAFSGIAFICAISMLVAGKSTLLGHIGVSSMAIYLAHVIAGSGVRVVLQKLLHIEHWGAHVFIGTLIGVVIPIVLLRISKGNILHFLFDIPKGLSMAKRMNVGIEPRSS